MDPHAEARKKYGPPPEDWEECLTADGDPYWYNVKVEIIKSETILRISRPKLRGGSTPLIQQPSKKEVKLKINFKIK
jgi:hypothetical protein